jgi:hypothetical protein
MTIKKQLNSIQDKLGFLEKEIELLKYKIGITGSSKDYYTKEDLAEMLKITTQTLSNYYKNNEVRLPKRSFYSKKNYIITKQDFYDWLNNQHTGTKHGLC